jgi:hypothetical protein
MKSHAHSGVMRLAYGRTLGPAKSRYRRRDVAGPAQAQARLRSERSIRVFELDVGYVLAQHQYSALYSSSSRMLLPLEEALKHVSVLGKGICGRTRRRARWDEHALESVRGCLVMQRGNVYGFCERRDVFCGWFRVLLSKFPPGCSNCKHVDVDVSKNRSWTRGSAEKRGWLLNALLIRTCLIHKRACLLVLPLSLSLYLHVMHTTRPKRRSMAILQDNASLAHAPTPTPPQPRRSSQAQSPRWSSGPWATASPARPAP